MSTTEPAPLTEIRLPVHEIELSVSTPSPWTLTVIASSHQAAHVATEMRFLAERRSRVELSGDAQAIQITGDRQTLTTLAALAMQYASAQITLAPAATPNPEG